jgi:hypothetical protein
MCVCVCSNHAETLIYDWTEAGDTEIVVEDIERIDFEQYGVYDNKMKDWRRIDKWDWNNWRQRFVLMELFSKGFHEHYSFMLIFTIPFYRPAISIKYFMVIFGSTLCSGSRQIE